MVILQRTDDNDVIFVWIVLLNFIVQFCYLVI